MQISLDTVREEPFTWQEELTIPADRLESPDLVELGPVSVEGRLEFFDPSFRLQARYGYRQELRCSRCLQPIEREMEGEIDILIEVGDSREPPTEVQLESSDLGRLQVATDEFDSEPTLIDELQLNIPMKPLCQTDCKGLCGDCGADLNREDCRCETAPIDPRWEALAAFKAASEDNDR